MSSLPKPLSPDKHLAAEAKEAIYYLRPSHIYWLAEVWPHRIDLQQAACRRCWDLAGERDYDLVRRYAAQNGVQSLYALCGAVAARGRAGSVQLNMLAASALVTIGVMLLWIGFSTGYNAGFDAGFDFARKQQRTAWNETLAELNHEADEKARLMFETMEKRLQRQSDTE